MSIEQLIEVFILLFIGMGPVKVLLVYIELTSGLEATVKRQMARRVTTVAGTVALGLFALGAFIQQLLHFSIGALTIAGGLVLLLLGLKMVLGSTGGGGGEHSHKNPMSLATSPLAIPLMLNPIGIVALITFSSTDLAIEEIVAIVVMILIIMVIDYLVLSSADRLSRFFSPATVEVLEKVLGILLAALAVELMLVGLADALGLVS